MMEPYPREKQGDETVSRQAQAEAKRRTLTDEKPETTADRANKRLTKTLTVEDRRGGKNGVDSSREDWWEFDMESWPDPFDWFACDERKIPFPDQITRAVQSFVENVVRKVSAKDRLQGQMPRVPSVKVYLSDGRSFVLNPAEWTPMLTRATGADQDNTRLLIGSGETLSSMQWLQANLKFLPDRLKHAVLGVTGFTWLSALTTTWVEKAEEVGAPILNHALNRGIGLLPNLITPSLLAPVAIGSILWYLYRRHRGISEIRRSQGQLERELVAAIRPTVDTQLLNQGLIEAHKAQDDRHADQVALMRVAMVNTLLDGYGQDVTIRVLMLLYSQQRLNGKALKEMLGVIYVRQSEEPGPTNDLLKTMLEAAAGPSEDEFMSALRRYRDSLPTGVNEEEAHRSQTDATTTAMVIYNPTAVAANVIIEPRVREIIHIVGHRERKRQQGQRWIQESRAYDARHHRSDPLARWMGPFCNRDLFKGSRLNRYQQKFNEYATFTCQSRAAFLGAARRRHLVFSRMPGDLPRGRVVALLHPKEPGALRLTGSDREGTRIDEVLDVTDDLMTRGRFSPSSGRWSFRDDDVLSLLRQMALQVDSKFQRPNRETRALENRESSRQGHKKTG